MNKLFYTVFILLNFILFSILMIFNNSLKDLYVKKNILIEKLSSLNLEHEKKESFYNMISDEISFINYINEILQKFNISYTNISLNDYEENFILNISFKTDFFSFYRFVDFIESNKSNVRITFLSLNFLDDKVDVNLQIKTESSLVHFQKENILIDKTMIKKKIQNVSNYKNKDLIESKSISQEDFELVSLCFEKSNIKKMWLKNNSNYLFFLEDFEILEENEKYFLLKKNNKILKVLKVIL